MKVFLCYLQRRNQLHYLARHIPCCSGVWMRLPNTSQRPGGNSCDSRSEIGCASSTSSLSPGEALSILASRSTSRRRQHVYCPLAQALHQQLQLPPGIVLAPATHYFRAREWCSQRHEIAPHAQEQIKDIIIILLVQCPVRVCLLLQCVPLCVIV